MSSVCASPCIKRVWQSIPLLLRIASFCFESLTLAPVFRRLCHRLDFYKKKSSPRPGIILLGASSPSFSNSWVSKKGKRSRAVFFLISIFILNLKTGLLQGGGGGGGKTHTPHPGFHPK